MEILLNSKYISVGNLGQRMVIFNLAVRAGGQRLFRSWPGFRAKKVFEHSWGWGLFVILYRGFIATIVLALVIYSSVVILQYGWGLFPLVFGDIYAVNWRGQFNADFMALLALSALWVAWRNQFTAKGLTLAVLAFFGGAPFLCIYLLVLNRMHEGHLPTILLGGNES